MASQFRSVFHLANCLISWRSKQSTTAHYWRPPKNYDGYNCFSRDMTESLLWIDFMALLWSNCYLPCSCLADHKLAHRDQHILPHLCGTESNTFTFRHEAIALDSVYRESNEKTNQFPSGPVATRLSGPKQPASTGFMVQGEVSSQFGKAGIMVFEHWRDPSINDWKHMFSSLFSTTCLISSSATRPHARQCVFPTPYLSTLRKGRSPCQWVEALLRCTRSR